MGQDSPPQKIFFLIQHSDLKVEFETNAMHVHSRPAYLKKKLKYLFV